MERGVGLKKKTIILYQVKKTEYIYPSNPVWKKEKKRETNWHSTSKITVSTLFIDWYFFSFIYQKTVGKVNTY